ncbi:PAS domain-containing protein [Mucilaginibacter sp. PAMB04168]|uniref:PAS domain-containing protein n=1 Tax=Mucilaginibacter sp. PAMB04168 TaxID=3138567 RepID=UPI0031F64825
MLNIPSFLLGGGQMGELIRTTDWSVSVLSTPDTWPESLKAAVSISLNSGFPIAIYWGSDFILLYNDAWSTIPGDKHPWALGKPGAVVWPEIWDGLDAQFKSVLTKGESIRQPDALLLMHRYGYTEECYFDYSLSPIMATDGTIGGVFNAVIETTYKVINERRNKHLQRLQNQLNQSHSLMEAVADVENILDNCQEDIPFYLLFSTENKNTQPQLVASGGIAENDGLSVSWPHSNGSGNVEHIPDLDKYLPHAVQSIWGEPCREALIAPISRDEAKITGYLVMGLSPRKKLDSDYQHFLASVAIYVGTILNNGFAYEQSGALQREQILNEELATTNEELSATNDELHLSQIHLAALNSELEERVLSRTKDLAESEARFRSLIEQSPVPTMVTRGPNMRLEVVNPPMLLLIDKDNSIIGKNLFDAMPELAGQAIIERLEQTYQNGKEWTGYEQAVLLNRNGEQGTGYFNILYKPLLEKGEVTGVIQSAVDVTEQVVARQRIEESENNLRNMVMSAHYALMILHGRDWLIEIANQQLVNLWSKTIDEVTGRTLLEVLPELEGQPFPNLLKQVYETGKGYGQEEEVFYLQIGDKSVQKYVSFYYDPIFDNQGNVTGIIVAAEDITDKVQTRQLLERSYVEQQNLNEELMSTNEELASANEELLSTNEELAATRDSLKEIVSRLAESEARLRYMLADAPIAISLLTGKDLIIEAANNKVLEAWGKTSEVIGMPLSEALPELQGQDFLNILDNVYTTGEPYYGNEVKALLEHKGVIEEVYTNFVYHPLKDEEGKTTSIVLVANIVTEQVLTRKKVEQTEEMLRFSVEAAKVGTWHMNIETNEFTASARCKELLGFYANDAINYHTIIEQIPDEYRHYVETSVNRAISRGDSYHVEHPVIGYHDQKLRWVRAAGKLNQNTQGKSAYFSGVLMDITEQKQDEVRKNDFIGMVSHELKTPLTSLSAYVQMLHARATKADDAFTANALDKVNVQVKKMGTLINGFLNVSRLEAGKIHLDKAPFRLDELVKEIVDENRLTVHSHQIILLPCEEVTINADRDKIGSVISNLLSNAVKYSPKGKTIEVNCLVIDNNIRVGVKDEGMGIRPEDTEKLFERYYRVDSKHTQTISGFGIGLYLCAEIIQRHDGLIWVDSQVGIGSTFYFSLPLA